MRWGVGFLSPSAETYSNTLWSEVEEVQQFYVTENDRKRLVQTFFPQEEIELS